MAIYRAQIGFPVDSVLPKDVVTLNPHYVGDSPQALADGLKANLIANAQIANTRPFIIKIYDAQKAPPSYPLATATNGTGNSTSAMPREVALCLSFYATWNRPSFRGRLYIPAFFTGGTLNQRPTTPQITNCLGFKDTFGKSLPSGHFWAVYSPKLDSAAQINNVWVDDEWDTVRSRGLRSTTRQTATLP
jgi:hypothetical protein